MTRSPIESIGDPSVSIRYRQTPLARLPWKIQNEMVDVNEELCKIISVQLCSGLPNPKPLHISALFSHCTFKLCFSCNP